MVSSSELSADCIDGQTEYSSTDTARCALGWHVMALHCTVLRARELFELAIVMYKHYSLRPLTSSDDGGTDGG